MHACMSVCVYVCIYVCMYVCMYTPMHVCTCAYYVSTYAHTYMYVLCIMFLCTTCTYACLFSFMYSMHVCTKFLSILSLNYSHCIASTDDRYTGLSRWGLKLRLGKQQFLKAQNFFFLVSFFGKPNSQFFPPPRPVHTLAAVTRKGGRGVTELWRTTDDDLWWRSEWNRTHSRWGNPIRRPELLFFGAGRRGNSQDQTRTDRRGKYN